MFEFQFREENKNFILDIKSPQVARALRVAQRLFDANKSIEEIANIKWRLTVIESEKINAAAFPVIAHIFNYVINKSFFQSFASFSLKNGEVFVFTGLLKFIQSDDELAIILAHEMSHAILQHAVIYKQNKTFGSR